MTATRGIDISRWQGKFAWQTHPGLSFGMAKATEGTGFVDDQFGWNWDAMWEYQADHRMPRFAYHFFHPGQDPVKQAEFFISTVKQHGLLPGDNLVLDLEISDGLHPREVTRNGIGFLHVVNKLAPHHRVLVYTYPGFAEEGNCEFMESWFLWIANYGVLEPDVPPPWSKWTFWQNGDDPIDTDLYNGTVESLLAFTRMPDKR